MDHDKENFHQLACICDKCQYDEASFLEKIQFKLHLMFCETCKDYASKNSRLSALIKQANISCLSLEEQKELKSYLKDKIT
ncbi:MAG: hypothetical protein ACTJGD_11295 [Mesonia hippocampi]|uniref:hypothetical protein n=1 Tax=Mesonia hippocampi TaxID=1628250 RepID=UPI003F9C0962